MIPAIVETVGRWLGVTSDFSIAVAYGVVLGGLVLAVGYFIFFIAAAGLMALIRAMEK